MAAITLHYNVRNRAAINTIRYILSLGIFKTEEKQPTNSFKKSIDEMQAGKTYKLKNTNNPLAEILK